MKLLPLTLITLALAGTAHAQIFADFTTTLGNFSIELDYTYSPKTVANFIRLAEGSSPWIHPETGAVVSNTPYYDGTIIFRIDDQFVIQAGSQTNDNTGSLGYAFIDELSGGTNAHYTISMANSGPNTNGGQFFINTNPLGNAFLDPKHTVFGSVTTATRPVIDTIDTTQVDAGYKPVTDVVMNSVAIRRVGQAAISFDEHAQDLPVVTFPSPCISGNTIDVNQPVRSMLEVRFSSNLSTWSSTERHLDADDAPLSTYSRSSGAVREFYNIALVQYGTDATFPSSLENRVITYNTNSGDVFVVDFANDTMVINGGTPAPLTFQEVITNPYGSTVTVDTYEYVAFRFFMGADTPITAPFSGRMTGTAFTTVGASLEGTFTMP